MYVILSSEKGGLIGSAGDNTDYANWLFSKKQKTNPACVLVEVSDEDYERLAEKERYKLACLKASRRITATK